MPKKFVLLLLVSNAALAMRALGNDAWPHPTFPSCEFYEQLERRVHCTTQNVNYLSDYAPFYCSEFASKLGLFQARFCVVNSDGSQSEWAVAAQKQDGMKEKWRVEGMALQIMLPEDRG